MSFKVTARTVLQLGAELISSDSVAFYELIKNAFDAGSQRVFIDVRVRMDHGAYLSHSNALRDGVAESASAVESYRRRILDDVDTTAPGADDLIKGINLARSLRGLSSRLEEANYIQIRDRGHGMSTEDLEEIYLTIGTPHRRRQRASQSGNRSLRPDSRREGPGATVGNEARVAGRRFYHRQRGEAPQSAACRLATVYRRRPNG